jgi:hypothetical protein
MPFYRFKDGIVHVKGTKLPDPCRARILLDGKEVTCMAPGGYLCDGQNTANKSGTCDAPLCPAHAHQIAPKRHLCPACLLVESSAQRQRSLFTSLVTK